MGNIKQKLHIVFDIYVNIVCNTYIASLNTKTIMKPLSPAEVRLECLQHRLFLIKILTARLDELLGEDHLNRNSASDVQNYLSRYQENLSSMVSFLQSIHSE